VSGSSNFLVFDENALSMKSDADYSADGTRINGVSAGMASVELHNKLYRQVSVMVAALAQWMADQGQVVSDSDLAALTTVVANTIAKKSEFAAHLAENATETQAGHVELATAAETTTGTDTTRAVHPAGLKVELDKKIAIPANSADGDILIRSGGAWIRLPKGTDGQGLILAAGLPAWGAASLWEKIGYNALGAPAAYVDFLNIPSDYDLLQIIGTNLLSADTVASHTIRIRFNSDSGSHYDYHSDTGQINQAYIQLMGNPLPVATYDQAYQINMLVSNTDSGKKKICIGSAGSAVTTPDFNSGQWQNITDKITSIRLYPDVNSFKAGCEFLLLGAKL